MILSRSFFGTRVPKLQALHGCRHNWNVNLRKQNKISFNFMLTKIWSFLLKKPLNNRQRQLQGSLTFIFMETYDFRKTPMCKARSEHMENIFHRIWNLFLLTSLTRIKAMLRRKASLNFHSKRWRINHINQPKKA